MARHKLKDKVSKTKKLYQFNSTTKKVNTEDEVKNVISGFIRSGFKIQKQVIPSQIESQTAFWDGFLASAGLLAYPLPYPIPFVSKRTK